MQCIQEFYEYKGRLFRALEVAFGKISSQREARKGCTDGGLYKCYP